jgi:hypothetical protein
VYAHYHYKDQDPALARSLAGRGLQVGEDEIAALHANFGTLVAPSQHHNNQFHLFFFFFVKAALLSPINT